MIDRQGTFIVSDQNTGEIGLVPLSCYESSTYPSHDALTFAHDLVEHVNGTPNIGTIEDELEALGCVLWIRGLSGELDEGIHSRYTHIASDLQSLFEASGHNPENPHGRKIKAIERPDEPSQVDDDIDYSIATFNDETVEAEEFAEIARAYMEAGAVKAEQLYGDWNTAYAVFDSARSAYQAIIDEAGLLGGLETFKGCSVHIKVTPDDFELSGGMMNDIEAIQSEIEDEDD